MDCAPLKICFSKVKKKAFARFFPKICKKVKVRKRPCLSSYRLKGFLQMVVINISWNSKKVPSRDSVLVAVK